MTDLNPFEEWAFLRQRVAGGTASPGDRQRMETLQERLIAPAVARAVQDVMPQIEAGLAKRRAALELERWRAQQNKPRRR